MTKNSQVESQPESQPDAEPTETQDPDAPAPSDPATPDNDTGDDVEVVESPSENESAVAGRVDPDAGADAD